LQSVAGVVQQTNLQIARERNTARNNQSVGEVIVEAGTNPGVGASDIHLQVRTGSAGDGEVAVHIDNIPELAAPSGSIQSCARAEHRTAIAGGCSRSPDSCSDDGSNGEKFFKHCQKDAWVRSFVGN